MAFEQPYPEQTKHKRGRPDNEPVEKGNQNRGLNPSNEVQGLLDPGPDGFKGFHAHLSIKIPVLEAGAQRIATKTGILRMISLHAPDVPSTG
jgi:hypothetical protein